MQKGKFRQIFKFPRFEWCRLMNGEKNVNFLLKAFLQAYKQTNPSLFHKCPYKGVHGVNNFSMPKAMVTFLPIGLFLFNTTVIEESSGAFFNVILLANIQP